jgi:hypothetical protein
MVPDSDEERMPVTGELNKRWFEEESTGELRA